MKSHRIGSLARLFLMAGLMAGCSFSGRETSLPSEASPHATATMQMVPINIKPEHILMYEVNIRAFSPSGDFQGVIDRLDEIKALGVSVIWLMPIFPIGQVNSVNSPYSVQDYGKVNPEFGPLADLKTLVDEAHRRDMAVILDWVANHTAWDHLWIENEDWYTRVNGEIVHPAGTNWQDVADLNYENPEMRLAMINALTYWVLEANVDGFRFDAADLVPYGFWEQAIASLNAIPDRRLILLAEGERADHYQAGFQLTYSWDFYNTLKGVFAGRSATELYAVHLDEVQGLSVGQDKLRFTTNHDESAWNATPVMLFNGTDGALAASMITITMGGVPLIYGSQEVGAAKLVPFFTRSPIQWSANPDMLQTYQQLLNYYLQSEALQEGELADFSSRDVACFTRSGGTSQVLVLVNVRADSVTFDLPAGIDANGWLDPFSGQAVVLNNSVLLTGYQYLLLERSLP